LGRKLARLLVAGKPLPSSGRPASANH
jgi:hypothetical protein